MPLQIIKGKQQAPVRAVIYGTEGIGKSTLATQLPDALVLDTEDGTKQIECARALCLDWRSVEFAVKELIKDAQGFKTVVIDSADWLEKALIDHMLRQSGKGSIEEYGYGKGYTILQEHVVKFLALVDQLIAKGVHVVFVAHAKVQRVSPPDETDGYDRYELKLTKQVAPLLKEWADLVLFCNYKIHLVEGNDGKVKAQGGKERVMYSERTAAWDAKNRFGLPEEMPMEVAELLGIFGGAKPRTTPKPEAKPETKPEPQKEEPKAQFVRPDTLEQLEAIKDDPKARKIIADIVEREGVVGLDELLEETAQELLAEIKSAQEVKGYAFPAKIEKWLCANEKAVNDYLFGIKWLTIGQTFRDLGHENASMICDRPAKFAKAARITWEDSK